MLIAGAKGHASEILQILLEQTNEEPVFFDDISNDPSALIFCRFQVIRSLGEASIYFQTCPEFILGTGSTLLRKMFAEKLQSIGGRMKTIIAKNASIGSFNVLIKDGVNIMNGVLISNNTHIGEGTLINARAMVHHDCHIGDYCEIGPGTIITGGCRIGENTSLGAGVILHPNKSIGSNTIIGAGTVVIDNIPDNVTALGVPAKIIKQNRITKAN